MGMMIKRLSAFILAHRGRSSVARPGGIADDALGCSCVWQWSSDNIIRNLQYLNVIYGASLVLPCQFHSSPARVNVSATHFPTELSRGFALLPLKARFATTSLHRNQHQQHEQQQQQQQDRRQHDSHQQSWQRQERLAEEDGLRALRDLPALAAHVGSRAQIWAATGDFKNLRDSFSALVRVSSHPSVDRNLRDSTLQVLAAAYAPLAPRITHALAAVTPLWACARLDRWPPYLVNALLRRLSPLDRGPWAQAPKPLGTQLYDVTGGEGEGNGAAGGGESVRWRDRPLLLWAAPRLHATLWWALSHAPPEFQAATEPVLQLSARCLRVSSSLSYPAVPLPPATVPQLGGSSDAAGLLAAGSRSDVGGVGEELRQPLNVRDCAQVLQACGRMGCADDDLVHSLTARLAATLSEMRESVLEREDGRDGGRRVHGRKGGQGRAGNRTGAAALPDGATSADSALALQAAAQAVWALGELRRERGHLPIPQDVRQLVTTAVAAVHELHQQAAAAMPWGKAGGLDRAADEGRTGHALLRPGLLFSQLSQLLSGCAALLDDSTDGGSGGAAAAATSAPIPVGLLRQVADLVADTVPHVQKGQELAVCR